MDENNVYSITARVGSEPRRPRGRWIKNALVFGKIDARHRWVGGRVFASRRNTVYVGHTLFATRRPIVARNTVRFFFSVFLFDFTSRIPLEIRAPRTRALCLIKYENFNRNAFSSAFIVYASPRHGRTSLALSLSQSVYIYVFINRGPKLVRCRTYGFSTLRSNDDI